MTDKIEDQAAGAHEFASIEKNAAELVELRKARGIRLAKSRRVERVTDELWAVPSEHTRTKYTVNLALTTCSCEDFELRRAPCKHVYAAIHARDHDLAVSGSLEAVVLPTEATAPPKRKTYKQQWPAYDRAQAHEKDLFQVFLHHLCSTIPQPPKGNGRPHLSQADVIFAVVMKIYIGFSGRRAASDIRACAEIGFIRKLPHWNTISRYLRKESLTPILKMLIKASACPLAAIEKEFVSAVDATGFTSSTYGRWYDPKTGRAVKQHGWVKLHALVGVATNIVLAAEVTYGTRGDSLEFIGLVTSGSELASLPEVSADKAYLSNENLEAVTRLGGVPFVPFKTNSGSNGGETWKKMFHYFCYRRDEFMAHYHRRSNVESTFSAIKRKFRSALYSKHIRAQINETLAKVLCHNLAVLVHEIYERAFFDPTTFITSRIIPALKGVPPHELPDGTPATAETTG